MLYEALMVRSTIVTVTRFIFPLMVFYSYWKVSGIHFHMLPFELPQSMQSGGEKSSEQGAHVTSVLRLTTCTITTLHIEYLLHPFRSI